ncbi:MAG TPA: hypothetical protein VJI33_01620 [Candidatus Paceibacterota bacterium]
MEVVMFHHRFRWVDNVGDEVLRQNVQEILEYARIVAFSGKGQEEDHSDYEEARIDLRSTLMEISEQPKTEVPGSRPHNKLWDAMMTIRPNLLANRLPKRFVFILDQELWTLMEECRMNRQFLKAEFFEKLHEQMAEKPVCGWRALISGGVVVERKNHGELVLHNFPFRIPRDVIRAVGLKMTTRMDNVLCHEAAITEMVNRGIVSKRVGEAMQVLAEDLYAYLKK